MPFCRESKHPWSWRIAFGSTNSTLLMPTASPPTNSTLELEDLLESFTKAKERIWALELEFEQAKRVAYEARSKEA